MSHTSPSKGRPKIDWSVKNYYTSPHDVASYLIDTIVMYQGKPYFVSTCSGLTLVVYALHDKKNPLHLSALDVDIASIELGYINPEPRGGDVPQAVYVKRMPRRRYKQGCCEQNTYVYSINGSSTGYHFNNLLWNKGFRDMINDEYPTLEQAFEILKTPRAEVALSKDIAIKSEDFGVFSVYFKMQGVGYMIKSKKEIILSEDVEFIWVIQDYFKSIDENWTVNFKEVIENNDYRA